jgi:hypothetical protein
MAKSIVALESLLAAPVGGIVARSVRRGAHHPTFSRSDLFSAGDEGDGYYRIDQGLLKASVTGRW